MKNKITLLFLISLGAAYSQTVNPGGGGGSSSVGSCESQSSTPLNCAPYSQTITQSGGTLAAALGSATLDNLNVTQLSASVTAFTITGATNGELVTIYDCQASSGGPYTIASPSGWPTIPVHPQASACLLATYEYYNSSNIQLQSVVVQGSAPGVQYAQTAPTDAGLSSGVYYCYSTSTLPNVCMDSNGNVWQGIYSVTGASSLSGGVITTTKQIYKFGAAFGAPSSGTALTTTTVGYSTPAPAACTITHWTIEVDSGTATVQFMKVAAGTALPTHASNNINTAGVAISTGTVVRSTTLTDFTTTSVAAGDIVGVYLTTLSGPDYLAAEFECQ